MQWQQSFDESSAVVGEKFGFAQMVFRQCTKVMQVKLFTRRARFIRREQSIFINIIGANMVWRVCRFVVDILPLATRYRDQLFPNIDAKEIEKTSRARFSF